MADQDSQVEYQVVAVDDGTSNELAGKILKVPDWKDSEMRERAERILQRMERLGWLDRV